MSIRKPTYLSKRLFNMLSEKVSIDLGDKNNWTICRTRAGYWQKASGAWTFTLEEIDPKVYLCVGSAYPATQLVKEGFEIEYSFPDIEMFPLSVCNK